MKLQPWLKRWIRHIEKDLDIKPILTMEEVCRKEYMSNCVGWAAGKRAYIPFYAGIPRDEVRWLIAHEFRHVWQDTKKFGILWSNYERERLISILISFERRRTKGNIRCIREGCNLTNHNKKCYLEYVEDKYHDILPEEVDANIYANSKIKRPFR
jgi:hypothetical protein